MKKIYFIISIFNLTFLVLALPNKAIASETGMIDLIEDPNLTVQKPSFSRPGYLQPYMDPVFGTQVTRITGNPGNPIINKDGKNIGTWGTVVRHWYSKVQPWNADESLLYLYHNEGGSPSGALLLDGQTYEPIKFLNLPSKRVRWHPTDPRLLIYAAGSVIGYYDVYDEVKIPIYDFGSGYSFSMGFMGEGNVALRQDGHIMAVLHDSSDSVTGYDMFAFDLTAKKKYPTLRGDKWPCLDWASISPSGNYVMVYWDNPVPEVYDLDMNFLRTLPWPMKHMDMGFDINGNEVATGYTDEWPICGSGSSVGDIPPEVEYQLSMSRLSDGQPTQLTSGRNSASHTSCRNTRRLGWSYNWMPNGSNMKDEGVAVELKPMGSDGSYRVQRFAHLHNIKVDYSSEAHMVPSWDGRRILWAGNWDEPSGRPISTYVADARDENSSPSLSPTPPPVPGDANDDGRVTIADYIIWLNHYGMSTGNGPKDGDFDNSGSVGIADYIIWLNNYGT